MLKSVLLFLIAAPAFGASVYYYDTLKIKAILDNREVENQFRAQTLPNGQKAVSLQGVEMGKLEPEQSRIHFQLKSAGCQLPVVLGFNPKSFNPDYRVLTVGNWVCP